MCMVCIALIEAHRRTYIKWLWVWHSMYVAAQSLQGDLQSSNPQPCGLCEVKKAKNHWVTLYLSLHRTVLVPNVSVLVVWQSHFDFFFEKTTTNRVLIWANLKYFEICKVALWKVVYYSNKIKLYASNIYWGINTLVIKLSNESESRIYKDTKAITASN